MKYWLIWKIYDIPCSCRFQVSGITLTDFWKPSVNSEVHSKPYQTYKMKRFAKIENSYFRNKLHHRHLTGFWIRLCTPTKIRFTLEEMFLLESFSYPKGGLKLKQLNIFIKSCFASLDVYMQTWFPLSSTLFAYWYAWTWNLFVF